MAAQRMNENDWIVARNDNIASHVHKGMVGQIIEVCERFEYPTPDGKVICLDTFRVQWRCHHRSNDLCCTSYAERGDIRPARKNEM